MGLCGHPSRIHVKHCLKAMGTIANGSLCIPKHFGACAGRSRVAAAGGFWCRGSGNIMWQLVQETTIKPYYSKLLASTSYEEPPPPTSHVDMGPCLRNKGYLGPSVGASVVLASSSTIPILNWRIGFCNCCGSAMLTPHGARRLGLLGLGGWCCGFSRFRLRPVLVPNMLESLRPGAKRLPHLVSWTFHYASCGPSCT